MSNKFITGWQAECFNDSLASAQMSTLKWVQATVNRQ